MKLKAAGLTLKSPIMNAAYIGSKTTEDIIKLIDSSCGAVVVGSITVKPRAKNPGPGYWRHKEGIFSLNSYGMPNGGLPYFEHELPKIVERAHAKNKPVIVNVAGFSPQEFVQLIHLAEAAEADMVELNLGCPNVWEDNQQKRILSYHPEHIKELLNFIGKVKPRIKIAVKLSPLPPDLLREAAEVIINSKIVGTVVACNSYPNASVSTGTRFTNENGLAGMTGRALKPINLGVVMQLHELLPADIDIIGCGGIASKNDVNDYLLAGAKAVQLATALVDEGLKVFDNLLQ